MRKYLLPKEGNFYKANLHCHSTFSDGKMTVEELKEKYKKEGYSIIAFTDHEYILDHSDLNDENFLAITACEHSITQPQSNYPLAKKAVKVCHLNYYAKDPHNVVTPCYSSRYDIYSKKAGQTPVYNKEYTREYTKECICDMIKEGNENGFLVSYNHPVWSLENACDYLGYKGLWAMEIYNTACVMLGFAEYSITSYDDMLRSGERIACLANDDTHSSKDAFGGHVMIKAKSLSYSDVMSALENKELYASTAPRINELYVEDGVAHIAYEGGEFAMMSTYGRHIEIVNAKNPEGENYAEFTLQPETDGYIRFSVYDKYSNFAHTCAYFFDENGELV